MCGGIAGGKSCIHINEAVPAGQAQLQGGIGILPFFPKHQAQGTLPGNAGIGEFKQGGLVLIRSCLEAERGFLAVRRQSRHLLHGGLIVILLEHQIDHAQHIPAAEVLLPAADQSGEGLSRFPLAQGQAAYLCLEAVVTGGDAFRDDYDLPLMSGEGISRSRQRGRPVHIHALGRVISTQA